MMQLFQLQAIPFIHAFTIITKIILKDKNTFDQ